uniref:Uncharacterized protein n=1 Tax=Aegilops tauschii subsp. strangulata TaxID=200361 RepID=A0A453DUM9_AEGTS
MPFTDLKNWNCAIGYGVGSSSPLSPSFNFALELVRSSQVCYIYSLLVDRKASYCVLAGNSFRYFSQD